MRKKQLHIVQGALIGFGIGAVIDILLQRLEHSDRGEKFTLIRFDGTRTLKNGTISGILGAGVGYIIYEFGNSLYDKASFNSDVYLKNVLRTESLKENPELLENALFFRDKLKLWMVDNFAHKLVSVPENIGSFTKRTANANGFDVDIVLPYRRDCFQSLEEMYNWTHDRLKAEFGNIAKVKKNTKAISILFEKNGYEISFDIVPGREINDYKTDKKLNLYVNPNVFWKKGSSFKIDTSIQRNATTNKPEQRRVIRLMKSYNLRNSLCLPSVIIEQAVVEALSDQKYGVYYSDTDNLLNSMEYLAKKLEQKSFINNGNSNNNLNNKISSETKYNAVHLLRTDIEKLEDSPYYLKEVFELTPN